MNGLGLVDRLRKHADRHWTYAEVLSNMQSPATDNDEGRTAATMREAADEIERLRAALAKLQESVEDMESFRLRYPGAIAAIVATERERCAKAADDYLTSRIGCTYGAGDAARGLWGDGAAKT